MQGQGQGQGQAAVPLVCVQRAGNVLYVPALWGRGALSEVQSIGVAFELSLEGFCME
jgi:hypothetical protein